MALKFKMQRFGAKNRPFYHIVVADSRSPRDGRFLERVGHYNPMTEPSQIILKTDRVQHWYQVGARPTDAVACLLRKNNKSLSTDVAVSP